MGEKLVCQALYNQRPGNELPSLTPQGTESPKCLDHRVQSPPGSPGWQKHVALSFWGPLVPR